MFNKSSSCNNNTNKTFVFFTKNPKNMWLLIWIEIWVKYLYSFIYFSKQTEFQMNRNDTIFIFFQFSSNYCKPPPRTKAKASPHRATQPQQVCCHYITRNPIIRDIGTSPIQRFAFIFKEFFSVCRSSKVQWLWQFH